MKLLRTLHTLTEIGSMVVQSVAAAVSVSTQRTDTSHEDRIAALEAELAQFKAAAEAAASRRGKR